MHLITDSMNLEFNLSITKHFPGGHGLVGVEWALIPAELGVRGPCPPPRVRAAVSGLRL